jgi:hypothetical protein
MKSQQALEETSTQTTLTKEDAVELNERSLTRLIYESSLYDHKPTARALLIAIAHDVDVRRRVRHLSSRHA